MQYKYIGESIEVHKKFILPFGGEPRACSDYEINNLEKQIGLELPLAYREFLKFMGKDFSGIFRGTDCFINNVIENTKYLPELLAENKIDFDLPQNYLAFFSHQGYIMGWFELPKENENPPVWFFAESDENESPKIFSTFSEWLLEIMRDFASQNLESK